MANQNIKFDFCAVTLIFDSLFLIPKTAAISVLDRQKTQEVLDVLVLELDPRPVKQGRVLGVQEVVISGKQIEIFQEIIIGTDL